MPKSPSPVVLLLASLVTGCGSNSLTGQTGQGGHGGGGGQSTGGAAGGTGGVGGHRNVVACSDTVDIPSAGACHYVDDCGPTGPVKCCTGGPCWPESACPFPPTMCTTSSMALQCAKDQDCDAGGTCVTTVSGCPQCPHSTCQYPPPPCTQSPDSCAPTGRCQPDAGTCGPLLCTEGWSCTAAYRCALGSAQADAHGCEPVPCDAVWTCAVNTRCTPPGDTTNHGCAPLACTSDGDCDCGYCVNGTCGSNLGSCSFAPQ